MVDLVKKLNADDPEFQTELDRLIGCRSGEDEAVAKAVGEIIEKVRQQGDAALLAFTRKFDRREVATLSDLQITPEQMKSACERVNPLVLEALKTSISRVRDYHLKQKEALGHQSGWRYKDASGNSLGQIVRPIQMAGVYVPGGKASYPSSIIMTVIPAKAAGVEEVVLAAPAPEGQLSDVLLATAHLCGVDRFFTLGGAQAIAALAYGTETVPRVDKIVGPGNIYVAMAKRMVFGDVGIDMIAGPSEVVVIADRTADTEWLVMDLFAQAEHDEMAQAILITCEADVIEDVNKKIEAHLDGMKRSHIIRKSLSDRGLIIETSDITRAVEIANYIAPEHLELAVEEPEKHLPDIKNAGAIFLGHYSPEVVGDYTAGPSHVLPTSGSARFASPLGVYDFQVRSSLIQCSPKGSVALARDAALIAREEGLYAHALAAEFRLKG